jgi:thiamine biosynthesis lipoprotein
MPLVETLPVGPGVAQWSVWSTTARVVVTDPDTIGAAEHRVRTVLNAVDGAASRFRTDSEIQRLYQAGGGVFTISPLLAELVRTALAADEFTGGAVDPTMGTAMLAAGYDRDFADLGIRYTFKDQTVSVRPRSARRVELEGCELTLPAGVLLDLGATAKAWAADRSARLVAEAFGTGALVGLGGDIATAGPAPDGGWRVRVQDGPDDPQCTVAFPHGAVATSSTISRTWHHSGHSMHHILDPYTGLPARPVWRTATVFAGNCVTANTASTAALVKGDAALRWLREHRLAARLVRADRTVVTVGGWPAQEAGS